MTTRPAIHPIRITDPGDPRLADYAGVREPGLLRARGLFLAEGRFVVRRLLTSARRPVRSLLFNDAAARAFDELLARTAGDAAIFVVPQELMQPVTGFNLHRGCLAIAERPAAVPTDELIGTTDFIVLLERVSDPDNIGSVFRCAEAFGVGAVLLSTGCGDPFYRKAIRTSAGSTFVVPHGEAALWPDAIDHLRAAGVAIVALTPAAGGMDIAAFVETPMARGRVAVLLGTEGAGLSAEAMARADVRVRIPMRGALDSLNIGTAAGIALQRIAEVRARPGER